MRHKFQEWKRNTGNHTMFIANTANFYKNSQI